MPKKISQLTTRVQLKLDDWFIVVDRSGNSSQKISVRNLFSVINLLSAPSDISHDDQLVLYDTSSSQVTKIAVVDIYKTLDGLQPLIAVDKDDEMLIYDVSVPGPKKMTVSDLLNSINSLTATTTPALTDLLFVTKPGGAVSVNKMTLQTLFNSISSLTTITTPAKDDGVVLLDGTTPKKATSQTLLDTVDDLTELDPVDPSADYVPVFDGTTTKKTLVKNVSGSFFTATTGEAITVPANDFVGVYLGTGVTGLPDTTAGWSSNNDPGVSATRMRVIGDKIYAVYNSTNLVYKTINSDGTLPSGSWTAISVSGGGLISALEFAHNNVYYTRSNVIYWKSLGSDSLPVSGAWSLKATSGAGSTLRTLAITNSHLYFTSGSRRFYVYTLDGTGALTGNQTDVPNTDWAPSEITSAIRRTIYRNGKVYAVSQGTKNLYIGTPDGSGSFTGWQTTPGPTAASSLYSVFIVHNQLYIADRYDGLYHITVDTFGIPTGTWTTVGEPSGASNVQDAVGNDTDIYLLDQDDGVYRMPMITTDAGKVYKHTNDTAESLVGIAKSTTANNTSIVIQRAGIVDGLTATADLNAGRPFYLNNINIGIGLTTSSLLLKNLPNV